MPTPESMVEVCDVVTINAPLHPETEDMFDDEMLGKMKRGAYLINTARGKICDRDAIVRALKRAARGLRGRRLVPAAAAERSSVADDATPRHDAAHLRHDALGAGPLRGRHARDPRVLVRRAADPRRIPDRRRRQARRHRRALLQRGGTAPVDQSRQRDPEPEIGRAEESSGMTIARMDHVGIVVDDLVAATAFFVELGLEIQGEASVEGGWVDRVVGLEGVQADIVMLETQDSHGRVELAKFHAPSSRGGDRHAPANTRVSVMSHSRSTTSMLSSPLARARRGAGWRGGALRRQLSALLRPRPRGDHRRAGGADRLSALAAGCDLGREKVRLRQLSRTMAAQVWLPACRSSAHHGRRSSTAGSLISAIGAALLAVSVFLPWYGVSLTAGGVASARQTLDNVAQQYGNAAFQNQAKAIGLGFSAIAGHQLTTLSAHQALKDLNVILLILAAVAFVVALLRLAGASQSSQTSGGQVALIGLVATACVLFRIVEPVRLPRSRSSRCRSAGASGFRSQALWRS